MPKRIVICCDGTWNAPDQTRQGIPAPTNVSRLAEAVAALGADDTQQIVYYDKGVGTDGGPVRRWFDGATGTGISENIRQAYVYLARNFEPGDSLYLFGFSRGAFTVRSLSGLIRSCGILRHAAPDLLERAWALYRSRSPSTHPREREATLFRRTHAVQDVTPIEFIGVWDTVGALGNPLLIGRWTHPRNRFHDTDLSSKVSNAYQALAIDELRPHFSATLWNQPQPPVAGQTLEQCWFVGVHSDVGGGYPETGLSDIALGWMLERARSHGLVIDPIELKPNPFQPVHDSRQGFYRLLPPHSRSIGAPPPSQTTHEFLHPTVLERYRNDPSYRPESLRDYFERNPMIAE